MKAKDDKDPNVQNEAPEPDELAEPGEAGEEQEIALIEEAEADALSAEVDAEAKQADAGSNQKDPNAEMSGNIKRILDIQLPVTVSFGSASRPLEEVLRMTPGSLIELETTAEEPVVLRVNNRAFAWGKVVDVDGYYGVEITEIVGQADRIATLGGH